VLQADFLDGHADATLNSRQGMVLPWFWREAAMETRGAEVFTGG